LKLCGRKIAHKTERGLVRLALAVAQAVRSAAVALLAARRADDGDAWLLVCRMVAGRREVIAGLVRDPQFGPCVMLGLGGIFAEAVGDVAFAVAPLAKGDAEDLIDALQYKNILGDVPRRAGGRPREARRGARGARRLARSGPTSARST
jgi:acetyl-CoA synthetase (ADP-forming)